MFRRLGCVIMLAAAANAQDSTAKPASTFHIAGTVVNALSGQAVSRVTVSIGPAEGPDSAKSVITSESGQFDFTVTRGKYWLEAQGRGYSAQRFDQHEEFSTAIAVGPNLDPTNLIFRLRPDATILGVVTDEDNEPVRGAQASLFRTGVEDGMPFTRLQASLSTDDLGQYRFSHLLSGNYYVAISARPWYADARAATLRPVGVARGQSGNVADAQTEESDLDVTYPLTFNGGVTDPNAATPLVLKAGDRMTVDIALARVPSSHLRITDSGLNPQEGFSTSIAHSLFGGIRVPISANYLSVKPGEVEISGVPPGQFVITFRSRGEDANSREKQIDVAGNSEVDVFDGSASCSITGTVQFDSGESLSQPAIVRLSSGSSEAISSQTSPKGEFSLPATGLRIQNYEVAVLGVPGLVVKSLSANGARVIGHRVEIAGSSVRLKIVVSKVNARVDGTALLDGKPFAGAMIMLVPQDIEHDSTLVRRDQSDSDGTFSLYNVLPGKYTVVAVQNEWNQPWLSPGVIQPFLKNGEVVDVTAQSRRKIKVNVQ